MIEIIADPVPLTADQNGILRVAGTRVTLDTVVACYQQGDSPADIVEGFPSLSLADVYAVITYYLRHQAEVDRYIAQNEHLAEEDDVNLRHSLENSPRRPNSKPAATDQISSHSQIRSVSTFICPPYPLHMPKLYTRL